VKRGFTLLETLIVLIMVGILVALAILGYIMVIERSRGAEARKNLGRMRDMCVEIFNRDHSVKECIPENLLIGTATPDSVPAQCQASHYFRYSVSEVEPDVDGNIVAFTATRCTSGGRHPNSRFPDFLSMRYDFDAQETKWKKTGFY